MNPYVKDLIQVITWITAVIGGGIAAFKAIYETQESRKQRAAELQWRRVNAAKGLLDDIHHHELARQAVHMLDWYDSQGEYPVKEGIRAEISYMQILAALKLTQANCKDDRDIFIRDCFDWFFYFVDRIEHYINREFISFLDVAPIFKPYAKILGEDWLIYETFLNYHEYELAKEFFERYPEIRSKKAPTTTGS